MDERFYLDVVSGRQHGIVGRSARAGLAALSPGYRGVVWGRNQLYHSGLIRARHVSVPVISVGNLTTGGTGKTPVVAWVCEWFRAHGVNVGLVSRGYRPLDAGGNDERRVLEQLCPGVPHVQNRDRVAAAREIDEKHAASAIVLDDGFQHRRLHRDLDLVLIDATNPWGYGHLLPRGLMREPRSSLKRADLIVLTRIDQVSEQELKQLRAEVRQQTQAPLAEVVFRPTLLLSLTGEVASVGSLAGEVPFAFCGIGNPQGFRRTLQLMGVSLDDESFVAFADHHHYTQQEIAALADRAAEQGATALVTTQKDLVKLQAAWKPRLPVWAVVIGADVVAGSDALEQALFRIVDETGSKRTE